MEDGGYLMCNNVFDDDSFLYALFSNSVLMSLNMTFKRMINDKEIIVSCPIVWCVLF